jgi:RNA polymerase sigma-70 factor (ECF subfamily)
VQAFAALLAEDVVLSMPPVAEWYVGPAATADFFRWATGPGGGGPFRLVPTRANGAIAFGVYGAGPSGPGSRAFLLSHLLADPNGITAITSFMNPGLFPAFNLPLTLSE